MVNLIKDEYHIICMVFISSKQNKQKKRGITIKIYTQGSKGSKTLTVHELTIEQAYDKIKNIMKNE